MTVFNSTMNFVAAMGRKANVDLNQLFDLIRETREHDLLFGPEIGEYITALYKSGNELRRGRGNNWKALEGKKTSSDKQNY